MLIDNLFYNLNLFSLIKNNNSKINQILKYFNYYK